MNFWNIVFLLVIKLFFYFFEIEFVLMCGGWMIKGYINSCLIVGEIKLF